MKLDHCSLMAAPANAHGLCEWCGKPRSARRRRWCSTRCGAAFSVNHVWSAARIEALVRSPRCVICGDYEDVVVHHEAPPKAPRSPYSTGCWNHQDRLAPLCVQCHVHEHAVLRAKPGAQMALFRAA